MAPAISSPRRAREHPARRRLDRKQKRRADGRGLFGTRTCDRKGTTRPQRHGAPVGLRTARNPPFAGALCRRIGANPRIGWALALDGRSHWSNSRVVTEFARSFHIQPRQRSSMRCDHRQVCACGAACVDVSAESGGTRQSRAAGLLDERRTRRGDHAPRAVSESRRGDHIGRWLNGLEP